MNPKSLSVDFSPHLKTAVDRVFHLWSGGCYATALSELLGTSNVRIELYDGFGCGANKHDYDLTQMQA